MPMVISIAAEPTASNTIVKAFLVNSCIETWIAELLSLLRRYHAAEHAAGLQLGGIRADVDQAIE